MNSRRRASPVEAGLPVERMRGAPSEDPTWRVDALAGSHHTRWVDELRQPLEDHDPVRAARICGAVARIALRDYAPALVLLDSTHRQRMQAVTAYGLTLFDFVRQTGLEGERLAAINRWEFELESGLDGRPTGQPVFVLLADLEGRQPWPRGAFDLLHDCARRRSITERPRHRTAAEDEARMLAAALTWLTLGVEPPRELVEWAAAMLRVRSLVDIGDDLRRHRCRLPIDEIPDVWSSVDGTTPTGVTDAIRAEAARLRSLLEPGPEFGSIPTDIARAVRYGSRASRRLLDRIDAAGTAITETPPVLSLGERLGALLRSVAP